LEGRTRGVIFQQGFSLKPAIKRARKKKKPEIIMLLWRERNEKSPERGELNKKG